MKIAIRILKGVLTLALLAGLYVLGVLVYGSATDFTPPKKLRIAPVGEAGQSPDSIFTLMTWNLGYCGQGAEADFFYDGGDQVIPDKEDYLRYREGVATSLESAKDVDVFLFQEIDSLAARSHRVNQVEYFRGFLPDYLSAFAVNYNVGFVPMPLHRPMGKVISGLATYSRLPATDFQRYAFDSQFSWPTRLFFLDRCFLSHRTPLENGKNLVVINTHCSAYDTAGTMVADEIEAILDFARLEYEKGNYVVIGGDWNQCPPNYTPKNKEGKYNEHILSNDQLPEGWSWVADPSVPTNRKLTHPYSDSSYTSVIDHFAISPNLEVLRISGVDQQFAFSDHQAVKITVQLLPEQSALPQIDSLEVTID